MSGIIVRRVLRNTEVLSSKEEIETSMRTRERDTRISTENFNQHCASMPGRVSACLLMMGGISDVIVRAAGSSMESNIPAVGT
jgi:hypothetical protein